MTRRLVDVSQDVIVREDDCDVVGIDLVRERARLATSPRQALELLKDKLIGRVLDKDVVNVETGGTCCTFRNYLGRTMLS